MGFRSDFVWGGASASYQVEGAAYEDGKGLSVWDVFCKEPGRILDGSSADTACDHYHLYREDVALMKEIGFKGYRFSISWPRVLPNGTGSVNAAGLDFYDRLVDSLLEAGITPYATMYHWDLPYALHQKGGWMHPDSPKWFAAYTDAVARRLGDRLKYYFTFNEPQCFIGLSYNAVRHAPGIRLNDRDRLQMMHHILLAHGLAVKALHGLVPGSQVGYAPTCRAQYPVDEAPENIEAARKAFFSVGEDWAWSAAVWSDPVVLGRYPAGLVRRFEHIMPHIGPDDMAVISEPIDFYGQNIYNGSPVQAGGEEGFRFVQRKPGYDITGAKWPVTPRSLYWGPKFLYERYGKPFYITENGVSCHDVVSLDGKVHDPNRIDFLHRYLLELRRADGDGVDIRGYFHWCVTDNFEWDKGYTERFGLVHCDFETQKRIPKDSAYWYRDVIHSNGEGL